MSTKHCCNCSFFYSNFSNRFCFLINYAWAVIIYQALYSIVFGIFYYYSFSIRSVVSRYSVTLRNKKNLKKIVDTIIFVGLWNNNYVYRKQLQTNIIRVGIIHIVRLHCSTEIIYFCSTEVYRRCILFKKTYIPKRLRKNNNIYIGNSYLFYCRRRWKPSFAPRFLTWQ